MPSRSSRERARAIVARHLIRQALETALDYDNVGWEDYPDLGENDWEAVVAKAEQLADTYCPEDETLAEAVEWLGLFANGVNA